MTTSFLDYSDDEKLKMLDEAMTAAAFTWTALRDIKFDPEKDDPEDAALHERVLASVRERHPWLDEAADEILRISGVDEEDIADG